MRFSQSSHLPMSLSLVTLTSIIKTGEPIIVELIELVKFVIIFLTQMVNFPTRIPDFDSRSPALLDLFPSFDASICSAMALPPSGNSDHVVSVSIDFPSNPKRDASFHRITYGNSRADWDAFVIILEMFHGKISLSSVLLLLLVNFASGFRLELMYISLIVSIRSSFTHLHGFQLLVLLP